jgi:hypothetical protein
MLQNSIIFCYFLHDHQTCHFCPQCCLQLEHILIFVVRKIQIFLFCLLFFAIFLLDRTHISSSSKVYFHQKCIYTCIYLYIVASPKVLPTCPCKLSIILVYWVKF